jgi:hypothetical protein
MHIFMQATLAFSRQGNPLGMEDKEYFDQIVYICCGLTGCWRLPVSVYSMFVYGNRVMVEHKGTDRRRSLNISEKCQRDVYIARHSYVTSAVQLKYGVPYGRRQ